MPKLDKNSKIYVAGSGGLVGSAIVRELKRRGFSNIISKSRQELDLFDAKKTAAFFAEEKPGFVFVAAAKVGGILSNSVYPAEFIHQNLLIQDNIIHNAHLSGVKKLLFLGSSCIYPRLARQPIAETEFLSGPLEETNKAYAVAKIAGIVMCQSYRKEYGDNFISAMPTNMYGPNDNFDTENSHVLPALIRKFHDAKDGGIKTVTLWGTGLAKREFLHVDDFARAALFLMEKYDEPEIINVGTGEDISVMELSEMIKKISGFSGKISWDSARPDGVPRKLLDVSKIRNLGWRHNISLEEGVRRTYEWYEKDRRQSKSPSSQKPVNSKF